MPPCRVVAIEFHLLAGVGVHQEARASVLFILIAVDEEVQTFLHEGLTVMFRLCETPVHSSHALLPLVRCEILEGEVDRGELCTPCHL